MPINGFELIAQRPRMPGMRVAGRLLPVLALVLLVACGGSGTAAYDTTSPNQIAKDASSSIKPVKNEHVKFDGTSSNGAVTFDADVEGQNFNGTFGMGGQVVKITAVDGKVYIYGPDILKLSPISDPTVAAHVQQLVGTNWVVLPNSSTVTGDLNTVLDMSQFAQCIDGLSGWKKKGTSTIEGDSTVEIDDSTGGQLFVNISSPHYPRRMILTSTTCTTDTSGGSGTFDLTQIGATFNIKAPTNVVDLGTLAGG
jgi:hypothetical protein